jgi:hypothetical protein
MFSYRSAKDINRCFGRAFRKVSDTTEVIEGEIKGSVFVGGVGGSERRCGRFIVRSGIVYCCVSDIWQLSESRELRDSVEGLDVREYGTGGLEAGELPLTEEKEEDGRDDQRIKSFDEV